MSLLIVALFCSIVATSAAQAAPPIKHVFVIVIENKSFEEAFGPASPAPYLSRTLTAQGQLLREYYGIGHASLDNYIALVSGQGPNLLTQSDCPLYTNFLPGIPTSLYGQYIGQGCVYPSAVKTVADQLAAHGMTWKGYMQDMVSACRHPALNAIDDTQNARDGDQYAARHNPFVYFHSIIDSGTCSENDVDLSHLEADLASASTTANYVFITPNLCDDGHDSPCVDGRPGGLASADRFLQTWVPRILASPAWEEGSLLAITFDEAESGDASACCDELPGLNTLNPGGTTPGPGGGRTGTLLISQFIQPGSVNDTPYNHYAFLRSVEDIFGLAHLGFASQSNLRPFGPDVYNAQP
ncbi:MAG TPA: alkaline phosphatase family protein [Steroidobacteraceae bacterium]|nr:alkaline phosphatase family protein [Steroidobacteraceae bacterium]